MEQSSASFGSSAGRSWRSLEMNFAFGVEIKLRTGVESGHVSDWKTERGISSWILLVVRFLRRVIYIR